MNYSMWMLYDKLRAYDPIANIKSDQLRINGLRVMSMRENPNEDTSKLYVWLENVGNDSYASQGTLCLLNGEDTITLPNVSDTSQAINALFEAINYFNAFESRMHSAVIAQSPQALLDLATELLGNPMVLADMSGSILAMSSAYADEPLDPAWSECQAAGKLPLSIVRAILISSLEGANDLSDGAGIYALPEGPRVIRAYFGHGREFSGGVAAWELNREFLPSDVALMRMIARALSDTVTNDESEALLHSASEIIADLLAGRNVDEVILRVLHMRNPGPWRLILLHNPNYASSQSAAIKSFIVARLMSTALCRIAMIHEGNVIALVRIADIEKLLNQFILADSEQFYLVCLSQPFDDLHKVLPSYEFARFLLTIAGERPGVYYAEDYGLQYILFDTRAKPHRIVHPALHALKAHDSEKNSDLYKTLFHYLINERGTQRTAKALHIHNNSLLYRLNQIRDVVDLDLDNPELRNYLILSFYIEADDLDQVAEQGKE